MLDAETKEGIRRSADRISSTLSDEQKRTAEQRAHNLIDNLHESFPDDDTAANVAFMIAAIFATLHSVPLRSVNQIIESSIDTYTFAAGRLAGVYELPLRVVEEPEAGETVHYEPPVADSPSTGPSPYL